MVNTGQTFRAFMSEVSKISNGVWWIDQYLNLHYHDRVTVNGPSITDGAGGVSGQNITYTRDLSNELNDIFVWGTMAYGASGDALAPENVRIMFSHHNVPDAISKYGLRQFSEFRNDLHKLPHVVKRAEAIKQRRYMPIRTATADVFQAGFSIGQVINLNLTTFGVTDTLVVKQVQISFPLVYPEQGGAYYGLPKYHLELGLEPDDPWNIYDMLPYDTPNTFGDLGSDWQLYPNWDMNIGMSGQIIDDFSNIRPESYTFQLATNDRIEERWWHRGEG
jgi:hypothetical protein